MKPEVVLEGNKIKSTADFHREIAKLLEFPDFYGKNLDALEDCLTGFIDSNVRVIWRDHEISKEALKEDFDEILLVFNDVKEGVAEDLELILA